MKSNAKTPQNLIPAAPADGQAGTAGITNSDVNFRLSAAKKLADELNDSRLWKIKISYQKRWTHLKRTQAVKIQGLKPWKYSTGPQTAEGKARSAKNSRRRDPAFLVLKNHAIFLAMLNRYIRLSKKSPATARMLYPHCVRAGHIASIGLVAMLRFSSQETP